MGYKNAVIHLRFDELGDECGVTLRNPRLMDAARLTPADVPPGPDGKPNKAEVDQAMYAVVANVILGWHVWDASHDDPENAPLLVDITAANVAKLPVEIFIAISKEIAAAVPSQPTP